MYGSTINFLYLANHRNSLDFHTQFGGYFALWPNASTVCSFSTCAHTKPHDWKDFSHSHTHSAQKINYGVWRLQFAMQSVTFAIHIYVVIAFFKYKFISSSKSEVILGFSASFLVFWRN